MIDYCKYEGTYEGTVLHEGTKVRKYEGTKVPSFVLRTFVPSYEGTKVIFNSIVTRLVVRQCNPVHYKPRITNYYYTRELHAFPGFRSLVVMTNAFQALDPSSNLGGCNSSKFCSRGWHTHTTSFKQFVRVCRFIYPLQK